MLVAPLAGAWIEILPFLPASTSACVAPLAGAWIEIQSSLQPYSHDIRRSPRGSVD